MKEPVSILKEALLTEKATSLSSNFNKYVFSVASFASKSNIKDAVEKTLALMF
jgi:ribosomal protein L23